jgi:hypothetical protein
MIFSFPVLSLIFSLFSSVERLVLFALHVERTRRWTLIFLGGDWHTPGNTGPYCRHCWNQLCEGGVVAWETSSGSQNGSLGGVIVCVDVVMQEIGSFRYRSLRCRRALMIIPR